MSKLGKKFIISLLILIITVITKSSFCMQKIVHTKLEKAISKVISKSKNNQYYFYFHKYSPDGNYLALFSITPESEQILPLIFTDIVHIKNFLTVELNDITDKNFELQTFFFREPERYIKHIKKNNATVKTFFQPKVTLFDTQTGNIIEEHNNAFTFMFSKNSRYLALKNKLIDLVKKKELNIISNKLFEEHFRNHTLVYEFSKNNRYLACSRLIKEEREIGVVFVDAKNFQVIKKLNKKINKYHTADYNFSHDEKYLATRDINNNLYIFDLETNKKLPLRLKNIKTPNYEFSRPTSKHLIVNSHKTTGTFSVYDVNTGKKLHEKNNIVGFDINNNNTHIAAKEKNKTLHLININDKPGSNKSIALTKENIDYYSFTPNGKYLYLQWALPHSPTSHQGNQESKAVSLIAIHPKSYHEVLTIKNIPLYEFSPEGHLLLLYEYDEEKKHFYLKELFDIENKSPYFLDKQEVEFFDFGSNNKLNLIIKHQRRNQENPENRITEHVKILQSYKLPTKEILLLHKNLKQDRKYRDMVVITKH